MFSNDIDKHEYRISRRLWGVVLGSVVLVAATATIVSARTTAYSLAIVAVVFFIASRWRGMRLSLDYWWNSTTVLLAAFLLFATSSAFWAAEPTVSLAKALIAALCALATFAIASVFAADRRENLLHMAEGLWIGFAVGLTYYAFEAASGQQIKIFIYNTLEVDPEMLKPARLFQWANGKLVQIFPDDMARNATPITLFLWPSLLGALGGLSYRVGLWVRAAILLLAFAAVILSPHETSKLALLVGLLAFGIAKLSAFWSARIVAAGWIFACLAILPLALIAQKLDLNEATWLQRSARHRIAMWNYTAEEVLKSPVIGVGAEMNYVLSRHSKSKKEKEVGVVRALPYHPHNVYLQTWYELGIIGATLLTLFGLAVLRQIGALTCNIRPYGYAAFASAATVAGFSYGMWQIWFLAMFGLAAAFFVLGRRTMETQSMMRERHL